VSFLVPDRRPQREMLDDAVLPIEEVERSLADIRWINRFWGGHRVARSAVLGAILSAARPQTLLDLGSGSTDVPIDLARKASRRGVRLVPYGLDLQVAHLATARGLYGNAAPSLVAGDAKRTPFPDGSFDWVISAQFFHHFSPEENVGILREMARLARLGIFVLDLRRHAVARLAVMGLGPFLFRSGVTRADARMSVEQAYTPAEVGEIARCAGLSEIAVRAAPPFRLVLSARP
jgi:SAM-dependent methyltransferase